MIKVFRVSDLHCSACVMRLEALEDELAGIRSVQASYQKQQMRVDWDETLLSEAQIREAVQAKGYTLEAGEISR